MKAGSTGVGERWTGADNDGDTDVDMVLPAVAGQVIDGSYVLRQVIGYGRSSVVWEAFQPSLERTVAVKILSSTSEDEAMRHVREGRIAATVRHRNVVRVYDVGMTERGDAYIVMERLRGRTLRQRMGTNPIDPDWIVPVLAGALSGVGAMHDAGIVHCDLTPGNIFLAQDADGVYPKLLDFGTSQPAKGSESDRISAVASETGSGSPAYTAPEVRGLAEHIDPRADIYSLGVLLYRALAGRDERMSTLASRKALTERPPHRSTAAPFERPIPRPFVAVVRRATAPAPEARFPDARAMRQAILEAHAAYGLPAKAKPCKASGWPAAIWALPTFRSA